MPITWFRPQQQQQQPQQQQQGPRPGGFFQGGSSNMPLDVSSYGGGNQPPPYMANQYGVAARGLSGESLVQWKAGTGQPLTEEETQILNQSIQRQQIKPMNALYDPRYGFAASGGADNELEAARKQSADYMAQWRAGQHLANAEKYGADNREYFEGERGMWQRTADATREKYGINKSQVGQWAPKSVPAAPVSAAELEREDAMRKAEELQAARKAFMASRR